MSDHLLMPAVEAADREHDGRGVLRAVVVAGRRVVHDRAEDLAELRRLLRPHLAARPLRAADDVRRPHAVGRDRQRRVVPQRPRRRRVGGLDGHGDEPGDRLRGPHLEDVRRPDPDRVADDRLAGIVGGVLAGSERPPGRPAAVAPPRPQLDRRPRPVPAHADEAGGHVELQAPDVGPGGAAVEQPAARLGGSGVARTPSPRSSPAARTEGGVREATTSAPAASRSRRSRTSRVRGVERRRRVAPWHRSSLRGAGPESCDPARLAGRSMASRSIAPWRAGDTARR